MIKRHYETHRLEWRGLLIEIRYCPDWSPAFKNVYGYGLAHIEVETIEPLRAPLPFSDTGYRGRYVPAPEVTAAGGPAAYIEEGLAITADNPAWRAREAAARQYSLL